MTNSYKSKASGVRLYDPVQALTNEPRISPWSLYNNFLTLFLQTDFNYSSPYWTNKETFAVDDGLEGLTEKLTKLASYWNTPFNKICLGMKVNGKINWISLTYTAHAFDQLIKAGYLQYAGKYYFEWLASISGSRLHYYCRYQGFNMIMKDELKSNSYEQ